MTNDDEGEGGVTIPPKNDDVIYEQPLMGKNTTNSYGMGLSPPPYEKCPQLRDFFLYGWTPLLLEIPQESFSEHQRFSAGEPLLQERGVHRLRAERRQKADDQHLPPDEVRAHPPTWQKKSLLPMQTVFLQVGSIKSMGQM